MHGDSRDSDSNKFEAHKSSVTSSSKYMYRYITWPFGEIARGELLTVQIRRDGWASGGWGVLPQTPRDSKRRQEAGPHRGLPRQGGVRSEGHVSVRCVYRPRMQALTTRRKSLAFQHSDIPGKNLQLTQRPQRHSSPRHTRRPTASPRSSPAPRPELLRRHASPPHCASSSASSPHRRTELEPRHLWRTRSTTRGRATTARARRLNLCQ